MFCFFHLLCLLFVCLQACLSWLGEQCEYPGVFPAVQITPSLLQLAQRVILHHGWTLIHTIFLQPKAWAVIGTKAHTHTSHHSQLPGTSGLKYHCLSLFLTCILQPKVKRERERHRRWVSGALVGITAGVSVWETEELCCWLYGLRVKAVFRANTKTFSLFSMFHAYCYLEIVLCILFISLSLTTHCHLDYFLSTQWKSQQHCFVFHREREKRFYVRKWSELKYEKALHSKEIF